MNAAAEHPLSPEAQLPEALTLEAAARQALLQHMLCVPEQEACGLLSGTDHIARHFYPVANVAARPAERYDMDPAQLIGAMRRMRARGEQLQAIVHSHPRAAAEPSETDIAEASYPEVVYLIVSLLDPQQPVLRGYRLRPECAPRPVALRPA